MNSQLPTQQEIGELLRSHRIYPTPQRVQIAQILFAAPQHMSAEQVLGRVNAGERAVVSKATVYNTLNLFAEKGLVRQVIVDPTRVVYDSNTGPHHHFFNVDTGELTDIEAPELSIGQLPDLPADTVVDGVDVVIRVRSSDQH